MALSSCSQVGEPEMPTDGTRNDDSRLITIRTNLPTYSSRGVMVDKAEKLDHCIVTIFNANNPHRQADDDNNAFNPWYLTELFQVNPSGDGFINPNVVWPERDSPETGSDYGNKPLLFYAYYPDMGDALTPVNNSIYNSSTDLSVDYALANFTVDSDISKHIDFMTAFGKVNIPKAGANEVQTVNLDFQHQLSGVVISAKGKNMKYDIEIAGVMIGNIIDKGRFGFQSMCNAQGVITTSSRWNLGDWNDDKTEFIQSRNSVAYIHADESEHVIPANDTPQSIMGKGGVAMILPFRSSVWDNINDPANAGKGTYFCVLIHVTDKEGNQIFPYTSESRKPDGYKPGLRVAATLQGKDYGWAAIPVSFNLFSGKKYSYTLDFAKGIGVLPPTDPDPGKPIVTSDHISISLYIYDWIEEEIDITPNFGGSENGEDEN